MEANLREDLARARDQRGSPGKRASRGRAFADGGELPVHECAVWVGRLQAKDIWRAFHLALVDLHTAERSANARQTDATKRILSRRTWRHLSALAALDTATRLALPPAATATNAASAVQQDGSIARLARVRLQLQAAAPSQLQRPLHPHTPCSHPKRCVASSSAAYS